MLASERAARTRGEDHGQRRTHGQTALRSRRSTDKADKLLASNTPIPTPLKTLTEVQMSLPQMAPQPRRQRRRWVAAGISPLARLAVLFGTLLLREAACFSAPRGPPAASVVRTPLPRTQRPLGGFPRARGFHSASNDDDVLDVGNGRDERFDETNAESRHDEDEAVIEPQRNLSLGYGVASAANAVAGLSLLWSAGSIGRSAAGQTSLSPVPLGAATHAAVNAGYSLASSPRTPPGRSSSFSSRPSAPSFPGPRGRGG